MRVQLHFFPTFALGGAQRRFLQLADNIPGWRHIVVSLDGNVEAARAAGPNAVIETRSLALKKSALPSPGNIRSIAGLIKQINPDLLCTYNWGATEVALANRLLLKRPHIHFEDGFGPEEAKGTLPRRNYFRRGALGGRAVIIVPSKTLEQIAIDDWHVPDTRRQYIPNGVDLDRFGMGAPRATKDPLTIGFVGALRPEKNVGRLIRAVRLAQERGTYAQLLIVGDGDQRKELEALAENRNVKATFAGAMSDPAPAYRDMDLFALTSDTEQMPLTVLEAMASGLPVIGTAVGDVPHIVSEQNKPFITALSEDDAGVASSIVTLTERTRLRQSVGENNRARVENDFDQKKVTASYAQLFEDVTGATQP